MTIRIKCARSDGGTAYLYRRDGVGDWVCTTGGGIPASFASAGLDSKSETACKLALRDTTTGQEALTVVLGFASRYLSGPLKNQFVYSYTVEGEDTHPNVLVEYFRKAGYDPFGKRGDYEGWSPERTAVYFLSEFKKGFDPVEWEKNACRNDDCPYYGTQHAHVVDATGRQRVLAADDFEGPPVQAHDEIGLVQLDELDLPTQDTSEFTALFHRMLEICKDIMLVMRLSDSGRHSEAEALQVDVGERVQSLFEDLQPKPVERDWEMEWKMAVLDGRTVMSLDMWRSARQRNEAERAPLDCEDHVASVMAACRHEFAEDDDHIEVCRYCGVENPA